MRPLCFYDNAFVSKDYFLPVVDRAEYMRMCCLLA